jgi:hypothetical protein
LNDKKIFPLCTGMNIVSRNQIDPQYLCIEEGKSDSLESQFKSLENKVVLALNGIAPPERPVRITTISAWLVYQLKTFNWLNLAVVLILLIQLQSVQHQNSVNQSTLDSISARENTLNSVLDSANTLLQEAKSDAHFVNSTSAKFSASIKTAFIELKSLNSSAVAQVSTIYQNAATHLENLNVSTSSRVSKLYHDAVTHLQDLNSSARTSFTSQVDKSTLRFLEQFHQLNESSFLEFARAKSHLELINKTAYNLYQLTTARLQQPMIQTFYSSPGNGIFTSNVSPTPRYMKVIVIGAGGGGSPGLVPGTNPSGVGGSSSVFGGNNLLVATGGSGAVSGGSTGGTGSCNNNVVSSCITANGGGGIQGGLYYGSSSNPAAGVIMSGTLGGVSVSSGSGAWGAGGRGGNYDSTLCGQQGYAGTGGGSGGYVEAVITGKNIQASYSYTVGSGGSGGTGCGSTGGNGSNGAIIIEQYF